MPTYEYECSGCGRRLERRQTMTEPPLTECPECQGRLRRVISGGSGFIIKSGGGSDRRERDCSLERTGTTCCGRDARCGKPRCGDGS
jgi:putative FmdB family regulatory protein